MLSVSLSGPDNVGKTTHLGLLPAHSMITKVGGLHESDEKIGELHRQQRLREWWWGSTAEEFVSTIFSALARRVVIASAKKSGVVVFDRGISMFESVAVAVIAMKHGHEDLIGARRVLDSILEKHRCRLPPEDITILLKHGHTVQESVHITMSRENDPNDERYKRYQRLLHSELHRQELAGVYQHVIHVDAADSIGSIQDRLREVLLMRTANPLFQPMMHNLTTIYAFGGLSECGKSSLAEAFCAYFGTKQAFRAKIAYFNSVVSDILGISVYDLTEKEQALHLFHELERFQRSHYWLKLLTIESLHRDSVTQYLKLWLGEKFQIVYIDADDVKRRERSLVPIGQLAKNDRAKLERGATKIRLYADLIVNNNGHLSESVSALLSFSEAKGLIPERVGLPLRG